MHPGGRRVAVGLLVILVLGAVTAWLLQKDGAEEFHRPQANHAPTPSREAAAEHPARQPNPAKSAPGRTPPGAADEVEERVDAVGSSTMASVLAQLQAIHAIEAQVEVSAQLVENATLAAQKVERYCERTQATRDPTPKPPRSCDRDAGPYLRERIDWADPPLQGSLHLPELLTQRLAAAGYQWVGAISPAEVDVLDFRWMKELQDYDCWRLVVPEVPPKVVRPPSTSFDFPSYVGLMRWAQLRLDQAVRHGDTLAASAEVRHLAQLIAGHQILLSEVSAMKLLEYEAQARQALVASGADPGPWTTPGMAELEERRRLARISATFLYPGVGPEVSRRALECTPAPCTALFEAAWLHRSIGAFSADDTKDTFSALLSRYGCNPTMLHHIDAMGEMSAEVARSTFEGGSPLRHWP